MFLLSKTAVQWCVSFCIWNFSKLSQHIKIAKQINIYFAILVRRKGLEPPTYWFVASHSIQLSYRRICNRLSLLLKYYNILQSKMQVFFDYYMIKCGLIEHVVKLLPDFYVRSTIFLFLRDIFLEKSCTVCAKVRTRALFVILLSSFFGSWRCFCRLVKP